MTKQNLNGRVIIITGASSGIGAATAIACAEQGMHVVLNARREDRLLQVKSTIEEIGSRAHIVVGDVTEPGMSARLLNEARDQLGQLDAVFANAGYGAELQTALVDEKTIRDIFEVNFFAATDLLRFAASQMLDDHRTGHLLMCSSCLAKFTLPYYGIYAATKAAQNLVCRSMSMELKPAGIHVSSVHPITTTTEFFQVAQDKSGRQSGKTSDKNVPDHAPNMFVQPPERVARAVVKCLRRPRPEVWTSHIVRMSAAMFTMFPLMQDWIMRKEAARRREAIEREH